MRIHTLVEFEWNEELERYVVSREEGFDYEGPLEHCGGGPSASQEQAAAANAELAKKQAGLADEQRIRENDAYNAVAPYAKNRLQNGLPYINTALDMNGGSVARSFAPARANLARSLAGFGGSLPSGFATQAMTDLNTQQGLAYDDAMLGMLGQNEAAKRDAAGLLFGEQQANSALPYLTGATQTNASIYGSPNLRKAGIGGILSGIMGGAMKAATL